MLKKIAYFFVCLLSIFLYFSCNYLEEYSRSETLVSILNFSIADLDPINTNDYETPTVLSLIYEGLFKYDASLKPVPLLADSWEVERNVNYKIRIKKGVLFHSGEELKASDVAFSLRRACESEKMAYLFKHFKCDSFRVVDDYTFAFSLKHPDPTVFMTLCHTSASIVSEKSLKKNEKGNWGILDNPIGTGPFRLEKFDEASMVLRRFDEYYGKVPYFKFMQFKFEEAANKRMPKLENGDVDMVCSLNIFEVERCKKNVNLKVLAKEGLAIEYLGMNMKKEPLNDVRVRKAISKGLDVDLINRVTSNGLYRTATSPCAPEVAYSIANKLRVRKRDVEGAKNLLFEAGYGNGLSLTFLVAESFERMEMAGKIKEQLWKIGIDLEMRVVDWEDFVEKIQEGEAELFLMGSAPDLPDPDSVLRYAFISNSTYEDGNYFGCEDEELDGLLREGIRTLDEKKRKEIYEKAQVRILELTPCVFIYYDQLYLAIARHYEGVHLNPLGYPILTYVKPTLLPDEE